VNSVITQEAIHHTRLSQYQKDGGTPRLVLQTAKCLEEVEISFRSRRDTASVEVDTFRYWADLIPVTVTTLRLVYPLFKDEVFDRDAELGLPETTSHLKNLKIFYVQTLNL
jgi:hypothetical protein